jgi:hypothetical protein
MQCPDLVDDALCSARFIKGDHEGAGALYSGRLEH